MVLVVIFSGGVVGRNLLYKEMTERREGERERRRGISSFKGKQPQYPPLI